MLNKKLLGSVSSLPQDDNFENVTLLLNGDGTNGGQNNTFVDSSTNNFTITRNGNTTQGSFSPYGDLWSNFFNGVGNSIKNTSTFLVGSTTSTFTAECWVNLTANTASGGSGDAPTLICLNGLQAGATYLTFGLDSANKVVLYWNDGAGKRCTGTTALQIGVWYHIAVSVSSNAIKLFVNGVSETLSGTTTLTNRTTNSNGFYVGSSTSGDPFFATNYAYVSNVRVNNTTALYSNNFTPSTTPLTAVSGTVLLTCQSNRFIDNSSNAYAWTTVGSPSVQRFSPFEPSASYDTSVIGGSGYFDGSGDNLSIANNTNLQTGTGNFTYEFWVTGAGSGGTLFSKGGYGTPTGTGLDGVELYADSATGNLKLLLGCGTAGDTTGNGYEVYEANNTGTWGNGAWHHIAVVRNGNNYLLFMDGVNRLTQSETRTFNNTQPLILMGRASEQYVKGTMANFRFTKGAALYTTGFTPPTSPLTTTVSSGTVQFLCNFTNASIADLAMQNNLETVGNAQVSTSVKKYGTGSLAFDGSGDWLTIPYNQGFNFGTGNFTIEGWFYLSSFSNQYYVLGGTWTTGTSDEWLIQIENNGTIRFLTTAGTSFYSASITTSTWYHFAAVRNGSTVTLYINGSSVGSYTNSNSIGSTSKRLYIGVQDNGASWPWNGYIDDLRITKGVARYTSAFTPPASALPTY